MATLTSSSASETVAVAIRVAPHASGSGLSSSEAHRRLTEFGRNEIRREEATSSVTLLARQFASPVIWLLLGASAVSFALGEFLDAAAIGVIKPCETPAHESEPTRIGVHDDPSP